jgi:hypothetical protein
MSEASMPEMELVPPDPDDDIVKSLSIFDEEGGDEESESLEVEVGDGWENIFDSANESVLKEIDQD